MSFFFHPEAKEEFDGAVDFYEQSQPGLGLEFAKKSMLQLLALFSIHMRGQKCQKTLAAA